MRRGVVGPVQGRGAAVGLTRGVDGMSTLTRAVTVPDTQATRLAGFAAMEGETSALSAVRVTVALSPGAVICPSGRGNEGVGVRCAGGQESQGDGRGGGHASDPGATAQTGRVLLAQLVPPLLRCVRCPSSGGRGHGRARRSPGSEDRLWCVTVLGVARKSSCAKDLDARSTVRPKGTVAVPQPSGLSS